MAAETLVALVNFFLLSKDSVERNIYGMFAFPSSMWSSLYSHLMKGNGRTKERGIAGRCSGIHDELITIGGTFNTIANLQRSMKFRAAESYSAKHFAIKYPKRLDPSSPSLISILSLQISASALPSPFPKFSVYILRPFMVSSSSYPLDLHCHNHILISNNKTIPHL